MSVTGFRYDDVSIVLSALAWIITPGHAVRLVERHEQVVARAGLGGADEHVLPGRRSGSTVPFTTSTADMTGVIVDAVEAAGEVEAHERGARSWG